MQRTRYSPNVFLALAATALFFLFHVPAAGQERPEGPNLNKPDRVEWFRDLGFGLFIHWSLDSQVGSVISHSLVGASDDYLTRYFNDLPKSFNPRRFAPDEWAALAKLAGFRYVVFTTKHHNGFAMYQTATTPFQIMNTPFARDITAEVVRAFRAQGIAPGFYYSPDDFWFLHRQGRTIARNTPETAPHLNPLLLEYDQKQLRELARNYGPIDMWFLDGPEKGLKEVVWEEQPDTLVTRGAMITPEQYIPGVPLDEAWEACLTMGTQWQYKPTNEEYKSGQTLIDTLIETRAKGGNLLLNIGPKPDGEIPIEQESRLREVALWMFINGESIYGVRPWTITNEGNIWFTHNRRDNILYAHVTKPDWKLGDRKEFTLKSVRATPATRIEVLGQNDKVVEYRPDIDPKTQWTQTPGGLRISAVRAQRIYNDRRWPNTVVLKLTNIEPGLVPPKVSTLEGSASGGTATLRARLDDLGKVPSVEAGFQYRKKKAMADLYEPTPEWTTTATVQRTGTGEFEIRLPGLTKGQAYEVRAVVRHPLGEIHGQEIDLQMP